MAKARSHIPISEIAASALADKLPLGVRNELRAREVPAAEILRMFTPDHIRLHTWGGPDRWFNLDMRIRDANLKAKDAADTARAAKALRLDRIDAEHQRRILAKDRGEQRPRSRWGKRPLKSRNTFKDRRDRKAGKS